MRLSSITTNLLLAVACLGGVNAAASDEKKEKKEKTVEPCTVSDLKGSFYDLRSLKITPPADGKKVAKGVKVDDWTARGFDYHNNTANFTLNICGSVIDQTKDFEGISRSSKQNVSAFYELEKKRYSIGQENSNLIVRGRRIVLEYKNGSPCGPAKKRSSKDDDDDDEPVRRKSTIISFHCDKDPLATQATASFVGALDDECSYHFEVLSRAACITAEPAKQTVGPGAVFAIIGGIAILVYFLGGVFYQRNVAHARGWRQLPNYSMWAGIGSFIKDIFIIATSSCANCMPSRRGYVSVSSTGNGNGRGRNNRAEDENRLIDQLDEEWDD